jgi:Gnt-I system high-affinity gluconate transporter
MIAGKLAAVVLPAVAISILLLVLLITWGRLQPFLAFLLVAAVAAALLGLPLDSVPGVLEKGIGGTLGGLVGIVCLGAMFGRLIADSGAAQKIATVLIGVFGERHITWAVMFTGFIAGIPLFYNVGFVLLVPLVFSLVAQLRLPSLYVGLPLLASLSVTHGFLPPHPSPAAMVPMFNADMGRTLVLGIVIAIPTMIIAGPLFARLFRASRSRPPTLFIAPPMEAAKLPGAFNSFATALLPVALIAVSVLPFVTRAPADWQPALRFATHPLTVMFLGLAVGTWTLGLSRGMKMGALMEAYGGAVKDIAVILLIIAGAGALKEVFVASGASAALSASLPGLPVHPLVLGWLIAGVIRISLGSATVAGLTAAGIMAPVVVATPGIDPDLMVLAIGAGSLMFSHVNDSGFWMAKEYFNLSLKQTLQSWTLMEGIVGFAGLGGVLLLDVLIH